MATHNKVAIVTGAGSGIGKAAALALLKDGYRVALAGRRKEPLEQAAAESAAGDRALAVPTDVSNPESVRALFAKVKEKFGRLDVLFNNAGTSAPGIALEELTFEQWKTVVDINLTGVFLCTQAVLRPMLKQKSGRIVTITSVVGLGGNAGQANYAASKAGLIGFTKSVAREVIGAGVRVNAIAPGYVETPLLDVMTPAMRQMIVAQTPAGRLGTPAEIAATAVFLASDEASYFVGQALSPNGGIVM